MTAKEKFIQSKQEVNELLKFWKAGLQLQESMEMKLSPINSRVASAEGRTYCKISFDQHSADFNEFLLRAQKDFSFPVLQDERPLLHWIHENDKKRKRFNIDYEQPFQVGFPTVYYQDQFRRERLSTLFKFNLQSLHYPSASALQNHKEGNEEIAFDLAQEWPVDEESFPYWVDETFLVEDLGLDPDLISGFRKESRKQELSPEDTLQLFVDTLAKEFCLEEQLPQKNLLQDLTLLLQAIFDIHIGKHPRKKFGVYSYALLYALEVSRPTRQLQNDLDDIINQNFFYHLHGQHPASLYLKGDQPEITDAAHYPGLHSPVELTDSQKEIVHSMYTQKLSVVQGPPGTGKTHLIRSVIAHRIVQHALLLKKVESRFINAKWVSMIASTNNQAVDHALQGLFEEDIVPVDIRLGSWKKMQETTLPALENMIMELSSRKPIDEEIRFEKEKKQLNQLYEEIGEHGTPELQHQLYQQARRVIDAWVGANQKDTIDLLQRMINDIEDYRGMHGLKKKDNLRLLFTIFPVIGSTLLSIRNFLPLQEELFGLLMVDEAGQCCPSYLFPALIRSRRTMLIGDTMQLEPISRLRIQDWNKLARSRKIHLEEDTYLNYVGSSEIPRSSQHLAVDGSHTPLHLKDHFRCKASIIHICEELCRYDLNILTNKNALDIAGLENSSLWYQDISSPESRYGASWCNTVEAEVMMKTVHWFLHQGVHPDQIALITPFRGQMKLLIKLLEKENITWKSGDSEQNEENRGITIGTVHRFQGGEKNIVLFSPVIKDGIPKFLNTRVNLLNVAVSRARDHFIFTGSLENLRLGEYTSVLHRHLVENGLPFPQ